MLIYLWEGCINWEIKGKERKGSSQFVECLKIIHITCFSLYVKNNSNCTRDSSSTCPTCEASAAFQSLLRGNDSVSNRPQWNADFTSSEINSNDMHEKHSGRTTNKSQRQPNRQNQRSETNANYRRILTPELIEGRSNRESRHSKWDFSLCFFFCKLNMLELLVL